MNRNFGWDHREDLDLGGSLAGAPDSLLTDMEALRIHDRFGISSWPQMIVMDPRSDRVIGMPERTVESVTELFDSAIHEIPHPGSGARRLNRRLDKAIKLFEKGQREKGALQLVDLSREMDPWLVWLEAHRAVKEYTSPAIRESYGTASLTMPLPDVDDPDPAWRAHSIERWFLFLEEEEGFGSSYPTEIDAQLTRTMLNDEDIVVRLRALRCLLLARPRIIIEHAAELLQVRNDPFRYEVLSVIERMPDPGLDPYLLRLFQGAGTTIPSMNPNVLRINIVRCLRESGDENSLEVLLTEISEPNPRNSLHGLIIETVVEIALRGDSSLRERSVDHLLRSFPPAVDESESDETLRDQELRIALSFARKVRTALIRLSGQEDIPELPEVWSLPNRNGYLAELHRLLGIG
ncbi:hypothetical protein ACFL3H_08555 [Gemmatimonadota bacterium]